MAKANMPIPPDGKGFNGSNMYKEEVRQWQKWMDDPKGTQMHQDTGSRFRPVSFSTVRSETVDEIYDRMVKRGIVAKEPRKSRGRK